MFVAVVVALASQCEHSWFSKKISDQSYPTAGVESKVENLSWENAFLKQ